MSRNWGMRSSLSVGPKHTTECWVRPSYKLARANTVRSFFYKPTAKLDSWVRQVKPRFGRGCQKRMVMLLDKLTTTHCSISLITIPIFAPQSHRVSRGNSTYYPSCLLSRHLWPLLQTNCLPMTLWSVLDLVILLLRIPKPFANACVICVIRSFSSPMSYRYKYR